MEMSSYIDNQLSFFDAEKIKERKSAVLSSMSEMEEEVMRQQYEELNCLPFSQVCTETEVMEHIPSIFDSEAIYRYKYAMLDAWECSEGVKTADEVQLLVAAEESNLNVQRFNPKPQIVNVDGVRAIDNFIYKDGLLLFGKDRKSLTVIGNFWITIKAEKITVIENVNEQNQVINKTEETTWEVDILCMGKHYSGIASVKTLLNEAELLKITMDRGYLESGKEPKLLYKRYINKLIQEQSYSQNYEYASTGWTKINQRWLYLTDIGVVGYPLMPIKAAVPYHFHFDKEKVGSKQIFEEFLLLKMLCPRKMENSIFLMHYMCLSTLTTLFQECGFGINFIVALIGTTNSQKTSSAIIFSRLFDRTPKSMPDIRFNSTEVAIMEKMESYGDAILLVDDFLPYEDRRSMNEQMKKSELIIRSYGDRVPRKRSKAYAVATGLEEFSRVKGCCIITGEVFDTNSESSATRVIQLNFSQGDVDLEKLTFFQRNLSNVPTLIYDFLVYVQENIDNVFDIIKQETENIRNYTSLQIATPRFRSTFGIMGAETKLFYSYAIARGFMSEKEAEIYRAKDMEAIENLIIQNEMNTKTKSPAMTIFLALERCITKRILRCISVEDAKNISSFENIIVDGEEYLCILPETLWNCYNLYCKEFRKDVIYKTCREMSAPLRKENAILVKMESDRPRSTHKINAKTRKRFLYIKKSIFHELCGIFDEY